jgi:PEGA domain-containing protein
MARTVRFIACALVALLLLAVLPGISDAQRHAVPRPPSPPKHTANVHGHVFIGGYFYDPMFGPYPWWPRTVYPYWYYPIYDERAEVRLKIAPKEAEQAAVFVDGFYAGIVDDFNNVFQSLPLTPGGHTIVLFLEGHRTIRRNVYLGPGSMFELRDLMERLAAGETSERPQIAPPVPAPPAGTYQAPVTPSTLPPAPSPQTTHAAGFGTFELDVQPADAEVAIDGRPWATSEFGHFLVQVPAGSHRLEVTKPGYWQFGAKFDVRDGQRTALKVSLMPGAEK